MKTTLIWCALAAHALASQPILVRVSPQTLADLQKRDPMIRLVKPADGEATVARPDHPSIIKQSTVLHDGSHWTMVPNAAIMFLPEALKARVNAKPVGKLLPWNEFLTKNQAWIQTSEVSFDQAAGNEKLPAEQAALWTQQDKLVIAVHQTGPISVRVAIENPSHSLTHR
jgi:hypothetical protein